MKIICLGDSLTRGFGVKPRETWVSLSNERLVAQILNQGISGDTSGGMMARFQTEVVPAHGSAVFIMGGGNDFRAGCPVGVVQSNILGMIYQAQARGIQPMLGLALPPDPQTMSQDWGDFPGNFDIIEPRKQLRKWLQEFARKFQIPLVDFYPLFFLDQNTEGEINSALYLDGLHPNQQGHQLMADCFCQAMGNMQIS